MSCDKCKELKKMKAWTVIGSCGHELGPNDGPDGFGWPVQIKDNCGERYSSVCTKCKNEYAKCGILIEPKGE